MICRGRGTKNVWNHVFIQVSIEMKAVELWTLTKHNSNGSKSNCLGEIWSWSEPWSIDGEGYSFVWYLMVMYVELVGRSWWVARY